MKATHLFVFMFSFFFAAASSATNTVAVKKGDRYSSPSYHWERIGAKQHCLVAQGAPVSVAKVTAKNIVVEYDGVAQEQPYCKKGAQYSIPKKELARYTKILF